MGGKNISILANLLIPSESARGRSPIKDLQSRTPKQPEEEMIERKRGRSLTKKDCFTNTEVRNNRDVSRKVVKEESEEDNAADDNRGRSRLSRLGDIYVEIKHIKAKPTNCHDTSVDSKRTTRANLGSSESEELSESERGRGRSRTRKDYRARKESSSPIHERCKVPTVPIKTQSMPPKSTKITSFENRRISPPSKTQTHSVPPATNGAPKRRGRPPGSKNRVKSKLLQDNNGDESSVRHPLRDCSQSLTRDGAPVPKRRGRPPGSKNRPKPANNVQSTTPTVKRRPGRPRKKPLPDDANTHQVNQVNGPTTQSITGKRKERKPESVNKNNQSQNDIPVNPRRDRPPKKKIAVSEDAESSQRPNRSIPAEPKPVYGRGKKYNFQHIIEKNSDQSSIVKSEISNEKRIVDEQNDPKRDIEKVSPHQKSYDSPFRRGRGKWVPSRQENFDIPLRDRGKYLSQNKSSPSRSPSPELVEIKPKESSSGKQKKIQKFITPSLPRRGRRKWVPKEANQDEIKRDIPLRSPSLESVEIMPRRYGKPNVKNQPSRNSNMQSIKTLLMLEANNYYTSRKRGPGRPSTKNRIPANINKRTTSLETFDSTQIPAKRPRGRPPLINGRGKTILPRDNTSTDESSSEESTESVGLNSEQEPTFQINNESENEPGSEEIDESENLNESVQANQKSVEVIPKAINKGESVELSSLLFPFSHTEPGLIQGLGQGAFRVGFKDSLLVDSQNLTPVANDVDMIVHDLF